MKTLVVYDSVFGNTEKIAAAIGNVLSAKTVKPQDFTSDDLAELDLLVVGSPTRAFKPTPAISSWIKTLPSLNGIKIAAFDTRASTEDIKSDILKKMMKTFGYAAPAIISGLKKKGGIPAGEPVGFFVSGTEGPLHDQETERAGIWAASLQ